MLSGFKSTETLDSSFSRETKIHLMSIDVEGVDEQILHVK